jgi:Tol biopolymer transport system component
MAADREGKGTYVKSAVAIALIGVALLVTTTASARTHSARKRAHAARVHVANGQLALPSMGSILITAPDGSSPSVLCGEPLEPACSSPVFSPDGTKIAYQRFADIGGGIRIRNLATGAESVVTTNGEAPYSWTPDGSRILFSQHPGIWSVPVGGGQATEILPYGDDPEPSPDGSKIAFDLCPPSGGICVANADGSGVLAMAAAGSNAWGPDWAPDGTRMVFTAGADGSHTGGSLFTMSRRGDSVRRVAPYGDVLYPVWSPDDKEILFAGNPVRGEPPCQMIQRDCYMVIRADGSDAVDVVGTDEFIGRPSWQPVRR